MDELTEALEDIDEGYGVYDEVTPTLEVVIDAARAYAEGRLPADFPTDEDILTAEEAYWEAEQGGADAWRDPLRAALLAVAERRQG